MNQAVVRADDVKIGDYVFDTLRAPRTSGWVRVNAVDKIRGAFRVEGGGEVVSAAVRIHYGQRYFIKHAAEAVRIQRSEV